jgi:hypothetical protein
MGGIGGGRPAGWEPKPITEEQMERILDKARKEAEASIPELVGVITKQRNRIKELERVLKNLLEDNTCESFLIEAELALKE